MDPEHSIYLNEMVSRGNELYRRGLADEESHSSILSDLENDLAEDMTWVPADALTLFQQESEELLRERAKAASATRSSVDSRLAPALSEFDRCLAGAELVNQRCIDRVFVDHFVELRAAQDHTEHNEVQGPLLRLLLMISLHSRLVLLLTEVSCLLRAGFPEGAMARSRSAYEAVVVLAILMNDHTNIVSERFHDSSVLEAKRHTERLGEEWSTFDADELAEHAQRAEAKWGREIRESNGWARPALPSEVNKRSRIYFTDLENAAGMSLARSMYFGGNHELHVGPFSTVNRTDFLNEQPFPSRPTGDLHMSSVVGNNATLLLEWGTRALISGQARMLKQWDDFMWLPPFCSASERARTAFDDAGD